MGRKPMPMQFIADNPSRRRVFRARRECLMKKSRELETLTGVPTCVIIYGPDDVKPTTYPLESDKVKKVLDRYKMEVGTGRVNLTKKVSGLHEFFENRKRRMEKETRKVREDNLKGKYSVSDQLPLLTSDHLSVHKLTSLRSTLDAKIVAAKERLAAMIKMNNPSETPAAAAPELDNQLYLLSDDDDTRTTTNDCFLDSYYTQSATLMQTLPVHSDVLFDYIDDPTDFCSSESLALPPPEQLQQPSMQFPNSSSLCLSHLYFN